MSATLKELHHALGKLLMKRPDLKDRKVAVSVECGLSSANIKTPVVFYINKDDEIQIQTTDDREFLCDDIL